MSMIVFDNLARSYDELVFPSRVIVRRQYRHRAKRVHAGSTHFPLGRRFFYGLGVNRSIPTCHDDLGETAAAEEPELQTYMGEDKFHLGVMVEIGSETANYFEKSTQNYLSTLQRKGVMLPEAIPHLLFAIRIPDEIFACRLLEKL